MPSAFVQNTRDHFSSIPLLFFSLFSKQTLTRQSRYHEPSINLIGSRRTESCGFWKRCRRALLSCRDGADDLKRFLPFSSVFLPCKDPPLSPCFQQASRRHGSAKCSGQIYSPYRSQKVLHPVIWCICRGSVENIAGPPLGLLTAP